MAAFNPPPGWPVPRGWSPPPEWSPDPSWPPAPPGWVFWADDAPQATVKRRRRWKIPLIAGGAVTLAVAVVVGILQVLPRKSPPTPASGPSWTIRPDWPSPRAADVDFQTWSVFGGVDARFGDQGRSVVLDTHDTTETWRTKWSGLIQPGPSRCDLAFTGRVRGLSHSVGVPGGFGIGLAVLGAGDPANAELTGTAIQFDFGVRGFRTAVYPDDTDHGVVPGQLDNSWHHVAVAIDSGRHTLTVDGHTVVDVNVGGRCGNPVLRVWAGSAEFADFSFA
ncbi:hypothetical protein [Mycolicibacterium sp.]|uniref:hypothetical protein n=1 Tax=Mycolicibacterium sp. TaxID=2320850 RepID=UPI0037C52363